MTRHATIAVKKAISKLPARAETREEKRKAYHTQRRYDGRVDLQRGAALTDKNEERQEVAASLTPAAGHPIVELATNAVREAT